MEAKKHLEELANFIRAHRNSEGNFEKLYGKLEEACRAAMNGASGQSGYADNLKETLEKHAAAYRQHKEKGAAAWPEFENFVSHFEKAVTGALHEA